MALDNNTHKYPFTDSDLTQKYVMGVAGNASGLVEYIGKAQPGTASSSLGWQIRKFTYDASGNVTDVQFAGGSNDYIHEMDEYASYSYS